jgi:hypothetical protein
MTFSYKCSYSGMRLHAGDIRVTGIQCSILSEPEELSDGPGDAPVPNPERGPFYKGEKMPARGSYYSL